MRTLNDWQQLRDYQQQSAGATCGGANNKFIPQHREHSSTFEQRPTSTEHKKRIVEHQFQISPQDMVGQIKGVTIAARFPHPCQSHAAERKNWQRVNQIIKDHISSQTFQQKTHYQAKYFITTPGANRSEPVPAVTASMLRCRPQLPAHAFDRDARTNTKSAVNFNEMFKRWASGSISKHRVADTKTKYSAIATYQHAAAKEHILISREEKAQIIGERQTPPVKGQKYTKQKR